MKNIISIFIIMLSPFILFGQSTSITGGAEMDIHTGASLITGDIELSGVSTKLQVHINAEVTAGLVTNTSIDRMDIFTDATGSGSLICTGTPKANVRIFVKKDRWNQLSPPTIGVVSGDFFDSTKDTWLLWFDESAGADGGNTGDGWTYTTSLTDPINFGEGRSFWRASDKTLSFTGEIRTGDLANALESFELNFTDVSHGYNLIGNPFTSALLWDGSSDWFLSNVSNNIWIWDGSQYISSPGGLTNHNIALGQAFFVRVTASNPHMIIPSSKRNHNASTFSKKDKNSGRNYLIINADNNGNKGVAYIYFDPTGTDDYDDGYDSSKLFGSNDAPQLYIVHNNMELTYNFLPTLDYGADKVVALNYIPGASGNQKLSFDFSNLTETNVYIEDKITGDVQNLISDNEYTFTGSKDDISDRFILRFSSTKESLSDIDEVISKISVFSNGNIINIISTNKAINESGTIFIYDITGREILSKKINGEKAIQIPIKSAKGSLIVKVVKGKYSKVEKVLIN